MDLAWIIITHKEDINFNECVELDLCCQIYFQTLYSLYIVQCTILLTNCIETKHIFSAHCYLCVVTFLCDLTFVLNSKG